MWLGDNIHRQGKLKFLPWYFFHSTSFLLNQTQDFHQIFIFLIETSEPFKILDHRLEARFELYRLEARFEHPGLNQGPGSGSGRAFVPPLQRLTTLVNGHFRWLITFVFKDGYYQTRYHLRALCKPNKEIKLKNKILNIGRK